MEETIIRIMEECGILPDIIHFYLYKWKDTVNLANTLVSEWGFYKEAAAASSIYAKLTEDKMISLLRSVVEKKLPIHSTIMALPEDKFFECIEDSKCKKLLTYLNSQQINELRLSVLYDREYICLNFETGVIINGVKWATRNVDNPGTFAAKPENEGMRYQWNCKEIWKDYYSINDWAKIMPSGTTWEIANDPSPVGWHVPTLNEIELLLDSDKVSRGWTTENGITGVRFTDKATGNSIFLSAMYNSNYGSYWSCTSKDMASAYALSFVHERTGMCNIDYHCSDRRTGLNVRPVAE